MPYLEASWQASKQARLKTQSGGWLAVSGGWLASRLLAGPIWRLAGKQAASHILVPLEASGALGEAPRRLWEALGKLGGVSWRLWGGLREAKGLMLKEASGLRQKA